MKQKTEWSKKQDWDIRNKSNQNEIWWTHQFDDLNPDWIWTDVSLAQCLESMSFMAPRKLVNLLFKTAKFA